MQLSYYSLYLPFKDLIHRHLGLAMNRGETGTSATATETINAETTTQDIFDSQTTQKCPHKSTQGHLNRALTPSNPQMHFPPLVVLSLVLFAGSGRILFALFDRCA